MPRGEEDAGAEAHAEGDSERAAEPDKKNELDCLGDAETASLAEPDVVCDALTLRQEEGVKLPVGAAEGLPAGSAVARGVPEAHVVAEREKVRLPEKEPLCVPELLRERDAEWQLDCVDDTVSAVETVAQGVEVPHTETQPDADDAGERETLLVKLGDDESDLLFEVEAVAESVLVAVMHGEIDMVVHALPEKKSEELALKLATDECDATGVIYGEDVKETVGVELAQ